MLEKDIIVTLTLQRGNKAPNDKNGAPKVVPRENTVQYCPLMKGYTENQLFLYYPTLNDNSKIVSKYT